MTAVMFHHVRSAAICLLFALMSSRAETSRFKSVTEYEIAGVHLGESSKDVIAKLRSEGFPVNVFPGLSFQQNVILAIAQAQSRDIKLPPLGIDHVEAQDRGETVSVYFQATPRGEEASVINYDIELTGRSSSALVQGLRRRFGLPDDVDSTQTDLNWCPGAVPGRCYGEEATGGKVRVRYSNVEFPTQHGDHLTVQALFGARQKDVWNEELQQAVVKATGSATRL